MQQLLLPEIDRDELPAVGPAPPAPYQKHSPTSREAAEAISGRVNRLQYEVLCALARAGEAGGTDEEIRQWTGLGETARPRRIELVSSGLVGDSGRVRLSAKGRKMAVWVVTGAGREAADL